MSTAEIIVCIALLFCTLVSSSNTKQSWEHFNVAEVNADKERLRNGNNLIYISFGSKPFLESTVVNIKTRFCTDQVTVIDVNKVDLSSKHIQSSSILFLENFAKISRNATIAQGLQRANALFCLHDSTTTIARSLVVILFEIETIDSDSWNTLRNKSWKKFVSEYFESSDAQVCSPASVGHFIQQRWTSHTEFLGLLFGIHD